MDIQTLTQALWPQGNGPDCPQVYALLDGARDEAIAPAIWLSRLPSTCLYSGPLSRSLERAAPYLVQLAPESSFHGMLAQKAWGHAWGIYLVAAPDVTLKALRKHLRRLLRAQDEQGRSWVFRFYDPRVLRAYLPTCTPAEVAQFYGPIAKIFMEDADTPDAALLEHRQFGKGEDHGLHASRRLEWPNMVTIRRAQMDALAQRPEDQIIRQLANDLRVRCVRGTEALGETELRQRVKLGLDRAKYYGLSKGPAMAAFVGLMFVMGPQFDHHPWIRRILRNSRVDPERRLEELVRATPAHIWREAHRETGRWTDREGLP